MNSDSVVVSKIKELERHQNLIKYTAVLMLICVVALSFLLAFASTSGIARAQQISSVQTVKNQNDLSKNRALRSDENIMTLRSNEARQQMVEALQSMRMHNVLRRWNEQSEEFSSLESVKHQRYLFDVKSTYVDNSETGTQLAHEDAMRQKIQVWEQNYIRL